MGSSEVDRDRAPGREPARFEKDREVAAAPQLGDGLGGDQDRPQAQNA
jgi:hypothetical protein